MGFVRRLLFIEPRRPAALTPVVDDITRKMCAAFREARPSNYAFGGIHVCYCGATSSSCDYHLPSGDLTNSLCVHYLAHHRVEVGEAQLTAVQRFASEGAEPNQDELQGPDYLLSAIRAGVERRLGPDRLETWRAWGLDVDALSQALRGGCLPAPAIFTRTRRDAQDLFDLLCSIPAQALPSIRTAALRSHGDLAAWGAASLRVPGWKRTAWMMPLADVLLLPENVLQDKRLVRMYRDNLKYYIEEHSED